MIKKLEEKEKAINLRKKGFSYGEILKIVPVAKSSLSLWLKSVGLSKPQKQRLTIKRLLAAQRGWKARRKKKEEITKLIKNEAEKEIGKLSKRELWLIGTALYWGEGSKEKNRSTGIKFSNSDPEMIKLFLKWLRLSCGIARKDIYFEIYLHKTAKEKEDKVRKYWSKITNYSSDYFRKTIWKKGTIKTKRENVGDDYRGQLRVYVKRSTNLNRKVTGWTRGICKNCGIV
jgi:hypothetical protein